MKQTMTQHGASVAWISVVLKTLSGHIATQTDPGKVGSTWNAQVCQIESMAKQTNSDATPFKSNRLSGQIVSHDVMRLTLVGLLLSQEPSHWQQGVNELREIPIQFFNRRL